MDQSSGAKSRTRVERIAGLLDRYYAGDDAAFDELHGLYFSHFVVLARSFFAGNDEADCEGLAQEALIKVMTSRNGARWQPTGSVTGWLDTVLLSLCRSIVRKREWKGRERPKGSKNESKNEELESTIEKECGSDATQLKDILARERKQAYVKCLEGLTEQQRLALTLRLESHENNEVARLLAVAASTATHTYQRAVALIGDCLRAKGVV